MHSREIDDDTKTGYGGIYIIQKVLRNRLNSPLKSVLGILKLEIGQCEYLLKVYT